MEAMEGKESKTGMCVCLSLLVQRPSELFKADQGHEGGKTQHMDD